MTGPKDISEKSMSIPFMKPVLTIGLLLLLLISIQGVVSAQSLTKVGQFSGGDTYVEAVKDNILFINTGPLIEVWNVTDRSNPQKITNINFEDYEIGGLAIGGNYLYVANQKGLVVVDISDLSNPQIIKTYYDSGHGYGRLQIINNTLYASGEFYFYKGGTDAHKFFIFDITDPYNISELGHFDVPVSRGSLDRFTVSGNYAFLTLTFNIKTGYVFIVDVSDPANPTEVATITTSNDTAAGTSAVQVDESRNILFVLEYRSRLRAYDISDPANPVEIGYLGGGPYKPPLSRANDMRIDGNYAYLSTYYEGIKIVDISDPGNMSIVATCYDGWRPGYVEDILVKDGYAYETCMPKGFAIFDVHDPVNPVWLNSTLTHGIFYNARVKDNYAYVTLDNEIIVLDVSSPENSQYVTSIDGARQGILAIRDNYLLTSYGWRPMAIINISNPSSPEKVNEYSDHLGGGDFVNDTLYIVRSGGPSLGNELKICDISNLPNITEIGSYTLPSSNIPYDVKVKGNYAYVSIQGIGVKVLDVSDPANITEVTTFENDTSIKSMEIIGDYLYMRDSYYLITADISDPANPVVTDKHRHEGFTVVGDYLDSSFSSYGNYLVSGGNHLIMWDISTDPAHPTLAHLYELPADMPGNVLDFNFSGEYLYLTIPFKGVYIYRISGSGLEISNIHTTNITTTSATITWQTNEPSTSLVKYGTSPGDYTLQKYDSSPVTSHSITLTDLSPNTTYYFLVNSTDKAGNPAQSTEYSFNTPALPTIKGDINQDGKVNSLDYSLLVAKWFKTTDITQEDLNKDGIVNVRDLGILMSNWKE